ncbi:MAG: hypothetical protein WCO26_17930 [Deltaproteobacteria bacterium]
MKPKTWFLLVLIVIIVAAGGMSLSKQILLLQLDNTDQPRTVQVRIDPSERFSIFYIHSIHREAVTEEFQADRDGIVLKGVRTKSPAVQEYYGFQDMKDFHPLNVKLGAIFIRVGEGEGQGLVVRDRKIYLSEVGKRGDRIRLRVRSVSLISYLYSKFFE